MPNFGRVLVTGMYRSGSTRVYNVIRSAASDREPSLRVGHLGDPELLDRALANPTPCLYKEHEFSAETAARIRRGDVRAVATLRDPLTTLVSLCSTFGWDADSAIRATADSLSCLEALGPLPVVLTYSAATSGNPIRTRAILRSAGIRTSWAEATRLSWAWSKRQSAVRSSRDSLAGEYDPVTLLHPDHVGSSRQVDPGTLHELRAAAEGEFNERVSRLARRRS